MSPFHVDATRMGGSGASARHSFGLPQQVQQAKQAQQPQQDQKRPRFIDPPPKRSIGAGTLKSVELSQAQISEIQAALAPIVEALQLEMEAIKTEADWVSGPTLRVEPDLYKSISIIGPYLSPQEIRSVIIVDANQIGSMASRMLSGSLASYLSPEQRSTVETVASDAQKLVSYIQQFDIAPLNGASSKLAQDHVDSHTVAVLEEIEDIEKGIVSVEAAGVPVVEPAEKGIGLAGLLAVGTLVAVGIIVADLM